MTDEVEHDIATGGPVRVPRSFARRVARTIAGVVFVVALVWAIVLGAGNLPQDTSAPSLVVRGAIGLGIGGVLIVLVRRMMRALADPPPPPPVTIDATQTDVVYECPVCGTRVRLEIAATAKAPKHCGEEMEAKLVAR